MIDISAVIDGCRRGTYSPTRDDVIALSREIFRLRTALELIADNLVCPSEHAKGILDGGQNDDA